MKELIIFCGILLISISCTNAFCSEDKLNNKLCPFGDNLDEAEKFSINNQFEEAASIYQCYLSKHSQEKQVYIDYVDAERAFENYNEAITILNIYKNLFGEDYDYQRSKARVFADAGFYDSALQLNNPLIKMSPNDSYLMATQASALFQSGKRSEGLEELQSLIKKDPKSDDIEYLKILIAEPLQSTISVGTRFQDLTQATDPMYIPPSAQFIHQNDTVNIYRVPIELQYYFNPTTSLLFSALGEFLSAESGGSLVTNTGESTISDQEYLIGIDSFVRPNIELQGLIGDIAISNGQNRIAVYLASKLAPNERWKISLGALHDLYRPIDLTNGSPRAVSLAIMETGGRFHANYKSSLQSTIDLDFRISQLSDNNLYERLEFEAGQIVFNTDRTNLMLGVNAEWLSFNKQLFEDGYYSPNLFQMYEIIGLYNINVTPTFYIELYAGGGISKDNFSNFGPAADLGMEIKYTIYKSLDLASEIDYVARSVEPFYTEVRGSISLTLRFP
jgi:hypothetical protein